MAKPIINKITPFDANYNKEILITWMGNRAHGNRIVIYDNDTLSTVYDDTVTSYLLSHTIPQYALSNGKTYIIQCQIFDEENISSVLSDKIAFYTFTNPDFNFDNLPANNLIINASFIGTINYYSPEFENISKYKFYLYDSSKIQLLESEDLYDTDNINYSFKGLNSGSVYYIRCIGNTVHGMVLDTDYVEITVNYEMPNTYARIYTENLPEQGAIHIRSNVVIIQYNGDETFEYENGMINLIGKTLYYDDGFLIEDDFTIIIRGKNLWQTEEIFKAKNSKMGFTISSRIYTDNTLRFRLTVPNGFGNYIRYSDPLEFTNDDMVAIYVIRKNNLYDIKAIIS